MMTKLRRTVLTVTVACLALAISAAPGGATPAEKTTSAACGNAGTWGCQDRPTSTCVIDVTGQVYIIERACDTENEGCAAI